MTSTHIPSTMRGDELRLTAETEGDDLLLARLRDVLRAGGGSAADVAVQVTLLLDLYEIHTTPTENTHAV